MKGALWGQHNTRGRTAVVARLCALVGALLAASSLAGCGANVQAVYEGDVRFEHCMALDARPGVAPTTQRTCWKEWVAFYTYGQTRDRLVHAQRRLQQLEGTSGSGVGAAIGPQARALTDWSGGPGAPGAADSCVASCEQHQRQCRTRCTTPACRVSCDAGLMHCRRGCR